jgi:hypothetical protein
LVICVGTVLAAGYLLAVSARRRRADGGVQRVTQYALRPLPTGHDDDINTTIYEWPPGRRCRRHLVLGVPEAQGSGLRSAVVQLTAVFRK